MKNNEAMIITVEQYRSKREKGGDILRRFAVAVEFGFWYTMQIFFRVEEDEANDSGLSITPDKAD